MDFDFNIILVPVTLLLGLVWLLDKLWLKQYKRAKSGSSKEIQAAQDYLATKKIAYIESLSQHNMFDISSNKDLESIETDEAPMPVKQAEREYREAKRQANTVTTVHKPQSSQAHFLIRWAHDYFPVLAVVLIVRSFIIEPFNIPSSSMVPALYTGDFVAVNKYAYGIRLPLTYDKVIDTGSPERGDVAVFRYPVEPKIYYIKRIIGLPGDTVSYESGKLSINGQLVPTERANFVADETMTEHMYTPVKDPNPNREWRLSPEDAALTARNEESGARYYEEQLGKHTYLRRHLNPSLRMSDYSMLFDKQLSGEDNWSVTVPDDAYFAMGDNTDRSKDSRYWGFVSDEYLAGKAFYVWMHKQPGLKNLPTFSYNRNID